MVKVTPFSRGDVLFREGEPCGHVLRVVQGEIEISRLVGEQAIVLGRVEAGQYVGEMAAIETRLHSATARAASDGAAEVFDVASFLDKVTQDPGLARELILRLSIRLRETDDELVQELAVARSAAIELADEPASESPALKPVALTLRAQSDTLKDRIGQAPVAVSRLPFVVGRKADAGDRRAGPLADLSVYDQAPYRLSRHHFAIENTDQGVIVRDLGSRLGANVNGCAIGRHFSADSAPLLAGDNLIVAGGWGSPFAFSLSLQAAETAPEREPVEV